MSATLAESDIRARTGLNVIAIQGPDGHVTNPPPSARFPATGAIVAIGSPEQRQAFVRAYARHARHAR